MKHLYLTIIVTFLCCFRAMSQGLELPQNIQSPNAAGLGKFGDVPVSYSTGSPTVSVPLKSFTERGITLDISLNYDASGVRVDGHPGWVGQNWSLSAGGVITRMTKNVVDEKFLWMIGPTPYRNYFRVKENLLNKDFSSKTTLIDLAHSSGDYEPDIFTFSFMGMSGKFFFGNDGQWKVSSDQNLKVIFDYTDENNYTLPLFNQIPGKQANYDKVIKGFRIKDEKGNTYVFGYDTNAIEYSLPFFGQQAYSGGYSPDWVANSWYLTKVFDSYGKEVYSFNYQRGYFIGQFYRADYFQQFKGTYTSFGSFLPVPGDMSCTAGTQRLGFVDGSLVSPVYLESIVSLGTRLARFEKELSPEISYDSFLTGLKSPFFHPHDRVMKDYLNAGSPSCCPPYPYLQSDNIMVISASGSSEWVDNPWVYKDNGQVSLDPVEGLKWYKLSYITFVDNSKVSFKYNDKNDERLCLMEVEVQSTNWAYNQDPQKSSYRFGYDRFRQLPKYLSKTEDHWGYNKGTAFTIESGKLDQHYNQRLPHADYMQIGSLSYIVYPTGGHTRFIYEPHSYSQVVTEDYGTKPESGMAGGLRIKKIIDYDGNRETWREFKYVVGYETDNNASQSSGTLARKPKYHWNSWRSETEIGDQYEEEIFSVNSIVPLSNSSGSHINYSQVVELRQDNGYTMYQFTSSVSNPDLAPVNSLNASSSPFLPLNDKGLERGKLTSVRVYTNENMLQRETKYTYRDDSPENRLFSIGSSCQFGQMCGGDHRYYRGSVYRIYYYDYDPVKEEVTDYSPAGEVTQQTTYEKSDLLLSSSNVRLTRSMIQKVSDGMLTTSYSYPSDLPMEPHMDRLVGDFRVGEVIQSQVTKNGVPVGATKATYKLEDGMYVPGVLFSSTSDLNALEEEVFYDEYDAGSGNLLSFRTRTGLPTSLIWGYGKRQIVLRAENATYAEIQPYSEPVAQATAGTEQGAMTEADKVRTALPGAMVTSYTYKPFVGVSSMTDPNGKAAYFSYDKFNRLEAALDHNRHVTKTYTYNYKEVPYLFLAKINSEGSYKMGDLAAIDAVVIGGSGNLSYDWSVSRQGMVLATGSDETLNLRMAFYGAVDIKLTVKDNTTGDTKTLTKSLYVQEVTVSFSGIKASTHPNAQVYTEGILKFPLEDKVSLTLVSRSTQGAFFIIGGVTYRIAGYGSQTVNVPVGFQSELTCAVWIEQGATGASAEITITSLEKSTTRITSPVAIGAYIP